jgi:hypothetical protein
MKPRYCLLFGLLLALALPAWLHAQPMPPADFTPEPATVVRWGDGYRYPQAGWIVLHIEGEPYERGYQHGRLLPAEIASHLRCFATVMNYKAPYEGWRTMRMFVNALFLRKFDKEYLEEMKGIADGASAAGARFDGRPIDLIDIVALNCWSELVMFDNNNAATPTGLEGVKWKDPQPQAPPMPGSEHCSAFAATGPATADGKIVFGHITMFPLYQANFYNVWIDVKPARGHRFVMCSYPGGIQSGMDYYINAAGLLISETTIAQTRFDSNGMMGASRIRKAIQYAGSIDQAVEYLMKDCNGLYTNEWLLGDINTNEIAMLELGTRKHKLWRSSKNEWFGDTPGFYWGCNNIKDVDVRLETIPSVKDKPGNLVFVPAPRDVVWQSLYQKHKGKIGVEFALESLTSPILAAPSSLDAKFTTTALARELKSWAAFGPPTGKPWNPTPKLKEMYPEIKPLVKNEWTMLGTKAPARNEANVAAPLLAAPFKDAKGMPPPVFVGSELVWRGTLLPKSDGDVWLAIAFADYHNLVSLEKTRVKRGEPADVARDKLKQDVERYRKFYEAAVKQGETSLADVKVSTTSVGWYRLAQSKGVLLLHQLRLDLGPDVFDQAMDDFGMKYGGTRVTTQQFQQHLETASGRKLEQFFTQWFKDKGLPAGK